jgi:sulfur-carrier protein
MKSIITSPHPALRATFSPEGRGANEKSTSLTIHLWGALRPHAENAETVSIKARTIRELFRVLTENYPGMEPHIKRGVAVSINGQIYRDQLDTMLPADSEIYLLPRVPGG